VNFSGQEQSVVLDMSYTDLLAERHWDAATKVQLPVNGIYVLKRAKEVKSSYSVSVDGNGRNGIRCRSYGFIGEGKVTPLVETVRGYK
jgi:hypothetical protein